MKASLLGRALMISLALALGITSGCRRKPRTPLTDIPAGRTGASSPGDPGPGGVLPADGGAGTLGSGANLTGRDLGITPGTSIPQSSGPLPRDQYNASRTQLASYTVYFDYDSTVVKASEKGKIQAVADYLKANPSDAVEVEGHCDERGTEEYNRSLGDRRALAVREALALEGINPNRLWTISFGEDDPAVEGQSEAAWSKNRRGEFVLLTPR